MTNNILKISFLLILFSVGLTPKMVQAQDHIVLISTNMGDMKFRLYNDTPLHRDAFIQLAQEGYYNETLFYRIIQNFLIQGGSRSSRNAPPGKRIGYGDPDKTVNDEIIPGHYHQKGALCAPRQPDEVNPFKQSDISQFYIVTGKIHTQGMLDTLEIAVNRPIRNQVYAEVMTPSVKNELKKLKEEKKVEEFRALADQIKKQIDAEYHMQQGRLEFTEEQRKAYTTRGGYPELDGKYTIFGECISGFDVIDKIAALKTDANNRPLTDVKIKVTILN